MNVLVVPFFALFGAFLSDQRGDVRQAGRNQSYWHRARNQARRTGGYLSEVRLTEQRYEALRAVARLRQEGRASHELASSLAASLEARGLVPEADKARRLVARIVERDQLLEQLEESVRWTAIEEGRLLP